MVRKINVREHVRKLPNGKITTVKKHKRGLPFSSDLDTITDKWAQAFIKKRMTETHPDAVNTSRIVFLYPNKLWAKHPDKYDVYRLDCDGVPEYKNVPKDGWPLQLIKVKGKFYVADKNGKFKRHFPPKEVDKFSKFIGKLELVEDKQGNLRPKQLDDYSRDELRKIAKEKEIKNYSKYNKKELGKLIVAEYTRKEERAKDLKEEIRWLREMEKDERRDKKEIRGMIEARQHDLKHLI
ncbi:MAG: Rho termination factor N-terminal domain-containing protein [Promethearchaeota archaeon]